MQYNYYFDVCALIILATIALTSLSRRWVPSYRQRVYLSLFICIFMATFAERMETYLQMHYFDAFWYHPAEMALGSLYFGFHLGTGLFYLLYVLAILDIYVDFKTPADFCKIALGYILGTCLVLVNIFVPILFYYDETGLYHRGKYILLFYLIAIYYVIHGTVLILKYRKLMRIRTRVVVLSYIDLVILGLIIQFFWSEVLIENFFGTISLALVYISLHNPSDMVDDKLNILNRRAFLEGLDLRTGRKVSHFTVFVEVDNIRALSAEIGYDQSENVMKKVASYLKTVGNKTVMVQSYAYRFSENCFAVTVHSSDEKKADELMEAIAERLGHPWRCGDMAIRMEGHCFKMEYPVDFKTASELMNRVAAVLDNLESELDTIVDVRAKRLYDRGETFDVELLTRRNINSDNVVIKYQPYLSSTYKVNYCADTVCYFIDDYGNEINMTGHLEDIKMSQTIMDLDEFVIRSACRTLSSWNDKEHDARYRLVVGVSQGELSRSDFIRRFKKILREEKTEPYWIAIKLTETTITTMNSMAEKNLRTLAEMKTYIVVDNFGSGYGDFQRLMGLPNSQVNLSHTLLEKALDSEDIRIIAEGVVNILHDISKFVGAVDVSSERVKKLAEELGCDFINGDYLVPPIKGNSFAGAVDEYYGEGRI